MENFLSGKLRFFGQKYPLFEQKLRDFPIFLEFLQNNGDLGLSLLVLWFLKNPTHENLVPRSVWKSLLVGFIPPFGSTASVPEWLIILNSKAHILGFFLKKCLFLSKMCAFYTIEKFSKAPHAFESRTNVHLGAHY